MRIFEDGNVRDVLQRQLQVVSRAQLLELGISDDQIQWALSKSWVVACHPGVYAVASAPPSWLREVWAAWLAVGPDAVVSHEAAARFRRFHTYQGWSQPTLLVRNGTHARVTGAVVHQTRDPWPPSVTETDGLPVTSPERTLIDLAGTTRKARLALVLDDAKVEKLLTYESVGLEMKLLARRGKRGFAALREILDERGPGHVPPNKELERKTLALYDRFGGPRPRVAWRYPSREQVAGCADFGHEDALLAVETDGRRWHQRIADAKRDHERDANAARHGVQVLRILYEHVTGDPKGTWELIMDTRAVRLRQLGRGAA